MNLERTVSQKDHKYSPLPFALVRHHEHFNVYTDLFTILLAVLILRIVLDEQQEGCRLTAFLAFWAIFVGQGAFCMLT